MVTPNGRPAKFTLRSMHASGHWLRLMLGNESGGPWKNSIKLGIGKVYTQPPEVVAVKVTV